jgi:hypothetical protein
VSRKLSQVGRGETVGGELKGWIARWWRSQGVKVGGQMSECSNRPGQISRAEDEVDRHGRNGKRRLSFR